MLPPKSKRSLAKAFFAEAFVSGIGQSSYSNAMVSSGPVGDRQVAPRGMAGLCGCGRSASSTRPSKSRRAAPETALVSDGVDAVWRHGYRSLGCGVQRLRDDGPSRLDGHFHTSCSEAVRSMAWPRASADDGPCRHRLRSRSGGDGAGVRGGSSKDFIGRQETIGWIITIAFQVAFWAVASVALRSDVLRSIAGLREWLVTGSRDHHSVLAGMQHLVGKDHHSVASVVVRPQALARAALMITRATTSGSEIIDRCGASTFVMRALAFVAIDTWSDSGMT